MNARKRKTGSPCVRCGAEPRVSNYSYGVICRREIQRERREHQRLLETKKQPRLSPHACNCGNPMCNGMKCDVVRA